MKIYTREELNEHVICSFLHGSSVYGTKPTPYTDYDIVYIVNDSIDLSDYPNGILEISLKDENVTIESLGFKELDNDIHIFGFQYITESNFINMVKNHHIIALESLWMPDKFYNGNYDYAKYFELDNWKLRQVISGIVNNSWAKCHKKLVVEKDYDFYRAIKSLYHCFRLYTFGIQIAEHRKITDYSAANNYWEDLWEKDIVPSHLWEDYKAMYQPQLNALRSELVKLCPKPDNKNK